LRPVALAALLLVPLLAGCASAPAYQVGQFAYLRWGQSSQSCQNGVCQYGTNHETLASHVTCGTNTTLSWDLKAWIHGSMDITVRDGSGSALARRVVSSTGHGSQALLGQAGNWTLAETTNDANGNLEVRLTCD